MKMLLVNPTAMPYNEATNLLEERSGQRIPSIAMPVGLMKLSGYIKKKSDISNIQVNVINLAY